MTADTLALEVKGTVEGDASVNLKGISTLDEAETGQLSFLSNRKYTNQLYRTKASAVLVPKSFTPDSPVEVTLIRVEDVYGTVGLLLEQLQEKNSRNTGIHPAAIVAESAEVDADAWIDAGAVIGERARIAAGAQIFPGCYLGDDVQVGEKTVLHAGVKIYHSCIIGNHCVLHSGAVVGSDGFGFAPMPDGSYRKIPQLGNVVIEDHVEIGANTTIDRATLKSTIIRKGVKLDNLIQVGHNVEIGENTVIAAQTGISGSTRIGEASVIAGQVGFAGHLHIAPNTTIGAQSGIGKDISESGIIWHGSPVAPLKETLRSQSIFRKLPEIEQRLRDLERQRKGEQNDNK